MIVVLLAALLVQAPRPGFRAAPAIFQQNCGTCHGSDINKLQETSPERVYEALTTGKMKDQAFALALCWAAGSSGWGTDRASFAQTAGPGASSTVAVWVPFRSTHVTETCWPGLYW